MSGMLAEIVPLALPLAAINWHSFFFLLFAAVACGCAIAVVLADNVVRIVTNGAWAVSITPNTSSTSVPPT